LKEDLANLTKKYHQLNSPSTFSECAKVQREIVKKKKELADFEGAESKNSSDLVLFVHLAHSLCCFQKNFGTQLYSKLSISYSISFFF
jgi:hypothetical protein